ncbi:hypothetical protein CHUAL_013878 [Chamberlinius hualienensis]
MIEIVFIDVWCKRSLTSSDRIFRVFDGDYFVIQVNVIIEIKYLNPSPGNGKLRTFKSHKFTVDNFRFQVSSYERNSPSTIRSYR